MAENKVKCPKCGAEVAYEEGWAKALCEACSTVFPIADALKQQATEGSDGKETDQKSVTQSESTEKADAEVKETESEVKETESEVEETERKEEDHPSEAEDVDSSEPPSEPEEVGLDAPIEELAPKPKLSPKEQKKAEALQKKKEKEEAEAKALAEKKAKKQAKKQAKEEEPKKDEPIDTSKSLSEKRSANIDAEKFSLKTWVLGHKAIVAVILVVLVIGGMALFKKLTAKPDVSFWTINSSIVNNEIGTYSYTVTFKDKESNKGDLSFYLTGCTGDTSEENFTGWFRLAINEANNYLVGGIIQGDGVWKLDLSNYVTCIKSLNQPYLTEQFNKYAPETYLLVNESDVHFRDIYERFMLMYKIASNGYACETETIKYDHCDMLTNCFTDFSSFYHSVLRNVENNEIAASPFSTQEIIDAIQPFVNYLIIENPTCTFDGLTRSYQDGSQNPTAESTIDFNIGRYEIVVTSYRKGTSADFQSKCTGEAQLTAEDLKAYKSGLRQIFNYYSPLGMYIYEDNGTSTKIMQSVMKNKGNNFDMLAYGVEQRGNDYEALIDLYDIYKEFSVEEMKATDLVFTPLETTLASGVKLELTSAMHPDTNNIVVMTVKVSNPTAKSFIFETSECALTNGRGTSTPNSLTLLKGVYKAFSDAVDLQYEIPAGSRGTFTLYYPCQIFDVANSTLTIYGVNLGKIAEERVLE